MYISKLSIRNYRNFRSATLLFQNGINTIIGENGSGKTNLFQALRILIDDSLPRNPRLQANDFNRSLSNWQGHWIIITIEFENLDNSDEVQTLATQVAGQMNTSSTGSLSFYFRPKHEIRKRLFDYSQESEKSHEGLNEILKEITIDDYESFFRGRTTGDFALDEIYENHVGNFHSIQFSDPDNEDTEILGAWLPREININDEMSCTFIQALRDVETDLKSYKSSPLINLLRGRERTVEITSAEDIIKAVDKLNEKIGSLPEVKELQKGVDKSIKQAVGKTYAPNIELRSELPNEMDKLFQSLKLWVGDPDDDGHKGRLWELSLGGANLIYLSLKLLEYEKVKNDKAANFLLIEEPEAHIHTHIQKTLFQNLNKSKTQIIVSTHSTHISSVSKIKSVNILSRNNKSSSVFHPAKNLDPDEMLRIERYLDAVRSNLLFAKGVLLVEGDAEQILIPELFKKSFGMSLDEIGISIINIGSTGFKNIGRVFHQDRINRKCAILTDLDTSIVQLVDNPLNDTEFEKHCRASQQKGIERKAILDEFVLDNESIELFFSNNTLEVSFAEIGNKIELKNCVDDIYTQESKRVELKADLDSTEISSYGKAALRLANKKGKGWFALLLAEKISYSTKIPDYILKGIHYASSHISKSTHFEIIENRLKMISDDSTHAQKAQAEALLLTSQSENINIDDIIDSFIQQFPDDTITKFFSL